MAAAAAASAAVAAVAAMARAKTSSYERKLLFSFFRLRFGKLLRIAN